MLSGTEISRASAVRKNTEPLRTAISFRAGPSTAAIVERVTRSNRLTTASSRRSGPDAIVSGFEIAELGDVGAGSKCLGGAANDEHAQGGCGVDLFQVCGKRAWNISHVSAFRRSGNVEGERADAIQLMSQMTLLEGILVLDVTEVMAGPGR